MSQTYSQFLKKIGCNQESSLIQIHSNFIETCSKQYHQVLLTNPQEIEEYLLLIKEFNSIVEYFLDQQESIDYTLLPQTQVFGNKLNDGITALISGEHKKSQKIFLECLSYNLSLDLIHLYLGVIALKEKDIRWMRLMLVKQPSICSGRNPTMLSSPTSSCPVAKDRHHC